MLLGKSYFFRPHILTNEAKPGGHKYKYPGVTINPDDGPPLLVTGCQLLDVLLLNWSQQVQVEEGVVVAV